MSQLKEIENRYYKECNVIMLPTKDLTYIRYNKSLNIISPSISDYGVKANNYISCQHLYITSSDEIKEGDWFINTFIDNEIWQHNGEINPGKGYKKILATTDKYLLVRADKLPTEHTKGMTTLPQPSQSFIKKYIELGGKIDKVLVEYQKYCIKQKCSERNCAVICQDIHYKLKTDSHNTITIKEVKEKMYSIEEVKNFGLYLGQLPLKQKFKTIDALFDEWKNL